VRGFLSSTVKETVIEFGRRSVEPFRIFDFAPNSLSDRVGQSRWSNTGRLAMATLVVCQQRVGKFRIGNLLDMRGAGFDPQLMGRAGFGTSFKSTGLPQLHIAQ